MSDLPAYPEAAAQREEAEGPPEAHASYASWGRRAAAYLVDALIVVAIIIGGLLVAAVVAAVSEDAGFVLLLVAVIGSIAFPLFYYIYYVGKDGQTWARRWLGIRVQHVRTGRPIGYGAATGRYLITIVFGIFSIPLLLDYLWPLWDDQNQTLHDKVASSVVVRL